MSDIAVVGQFAGSVALGAVGSTTILVGLYTMFLIGMGSGVNALVARFYGSRQPKDVSETVHTSMLCCLLIGLVVMAVGLLSAQPILDLLGTKPELMPGAARYLRIYLLGMPAIAIYNFGNGVFSAVGDTKKPLCFLSIAGAINVALNLFFVIVCHMDVVGVATASVISQYVSAVMILVSLFRCRDVYGLQIKKLRIHPAKAKLVFNLGLSTGLQTAIFQIANLFIQAGVNTFDATMVAGNSAAANADALLYDVMGAFYVACSSFIGQNYGAGQKHRIRNSYLVCLVYSFCTGAVLGLLLLLFGREFLSVFTGDTLVIDAGMHRLTIMGFSYAVSALMDCTIAACRGIGKSLFPTIAVIMGSCVFRVLWFYTVFAYFQTIQSLYLLYIFSWTITALAEILYFRSAYGKLLSNTTGAATV